MEIEVRDDILPVSSKGSPDFDEIPNIFERVL